MKLRIIFFALAFLLSFYTVDAVGINPGLTTADYAPNTKVEGAYNVYNSQNAPVTVVITTKGSLANYLTIPENKITLPANGIYTTNFSMFMPENLVPGKYETRIHLAETSSKNFLAIAVEYVIVVNVPYQGTHLTPSLILGGQSTNNLIISTGAINDGSDAIQSSQISVSITDASGKVMFSDTANTGGADIKQYIAKLFQADKTNWPESAYTVKMDLAYDGKTESISQSFSTITSKAEPQPPAESTPSKNLPENIAPPSAEQTVGTATPSENNKFAMAGILIIIIVALLVFFNARRKKEPAYNTYQYPYR